MNFWNRLTDTMYQNKQMKQELDQRYEDLKRAFKLYQIDADSDQDLRSRIEAGKNFLDSLNRFDVGYLNQRIRKECKKEAGGFRHVLFGFFETGVDPFYKLTKRVTHNLNDAEAIALLSVAHYQKAAAIPSAELIGKREDAHVNELKNIPEVHINILRRSVSIRNQFPVYTVINTECTGSDCTQDQLTHLSLIRYEEGKPKEKMDLDVHGTLSIYESSIREFCASSPLVGFNINVDLKFLYMYGCNLIPDRKLYDTRELCHGVFKNEIDTFRFSEFCRYLGIPNENTDSLSKCLAIGMLFQCVLDRLSSAD